MAFQTLVRVTAIIVSDPFRQSGHHSGWIRKVVQVYIAPLKRLHKSLRYAVTMRASRGCDIHHKTQSGCEDSRFFGNVAVAIIRQPFQRLWHPLRLAEPVFRAFPQYSCYLPAELVAGLSGHISKGPAPVTRAYVVTLLEMLPE